MELLELLQTSPETLAEAQRKALTTHVCARLGQMIEHIRRGEYDAAREMTFDSPAGDGMGMDNTCIDFTPEGLGKKDGWDKDGPWDIGNILGRLESLTEVITAGKTPQGKQPKKH